MVYIQTLLLTIGFHDPPLDCILKLSDLFYVKKRVDSLHVCPARVLLARAGPGSSQNLNGMARGRRGSDAFRIRLWSGPRVMRNYYHIPPQYKFSVLYMIDTLE